MPGSKLALPKISMIWQSSAAVQQDSRLQFTEQVKACER